MTNSEFSNEFDVLYNNITSNQAPGLDEYEKSVFLTKAQDEIIKAYFNPKSNKVQEGFDGSEKRQIDFSMLIKSVDYFDLIAVPDSTISIEGAPKVINTLGELKPYIKDNPNSEIDRIKYRMNPNLINKINSANITVTNSDSKITITVFKDSFFDMRDNTRAIALESDILMFINEYVNVIRDNKPKRLTVLPISYTEYSRLMNKPFKRPLNNQAWRILDNSDGSRKAELIIGPNDTLNHYITRYIKRPKPIILHSIKAEDLSLGGGLQESQECELDPILHPEILQRAVELAKSAYIGDLNSTLTLGQMSETNMGMISTGGR